MIARFWAWLTHRDRQERTARTVHAMREQAQIAEIDRHRIRRGREQAERNWLEEALTPRSRERNESEGRP